jgi:hypothetical protein
VATIGNLRARVIGLAVISASAAAINVGRLRYVVLTAVSPALASLTKRIGKTIGAVSGAIASLVTRFIPALQMRPATATATVRTGFAFASVRTGTTTATVRTGTATVHAR